MLISIENLSSLNVVVTVTTAAEHSRRFYIRNVKVVFLFSGYIKGAVCTIDSYRLKWVLQSKLDTHIGCQIEGTKQEGAQLTIEGTKFDFYTFKYASGQRDV